MWTTLRSLKRSSSDAEYSSWLAANPNGYVLNVRRRPDPDNVVLARCRTFAVVQKAHCDCPGEVGVSGRIEPEECVLDLTGSDGPTHSLAVFLHESRPLGDEDRLHPRTEPLSVRQT